MAEIKECPYCGEEILSAAKKCKHCGEWLNNSHSGNVKSKNSIKKIGNYFKEISAIVIGVTITLSASYWLGMRGEKRDMALYLNAIKLEIEENIKDYPVMKTYLKREIEYTNYLKSFNIESLNNDSLEYHANNVFASVQSFSPKTNAFEMFKTSGIMRLMHDKELLLSLWEVYESFAEIKETSEWNLKIKWDEIDKSFSLLLEGHELKPAPMYKYYYIYGHAIGTMKLMEKSLKLSEEMLLKLEDSKMLK